MGRGRIELKRVENKTSRQVTFSKRKAGLLKKTHELSVLCDAQIGLIIFSNRGKLFHYSSHPYSMEQIMERYVKMKTTGISSNWQDNSYNEEKMKEMKSESVNLQLSLQRYSINSGELDLSSAQIGDLTQLEQQLQFSLDKVRSTKFELLEKQMNNLKKSKDLLEMENEEMHNWLVNNQIIQKQQEQEQGMGMNMEIEEGDQMTELNLFKFGQQINNDNNILNQFTFDHQQQQDSAAGCSYNILPPTTNYPYF